VQHGWRLRNKVSGKSEKGTGEKKKKQVNYGPDHMNDKFRGKGEEEKSELQPGLKCNFKGFQKPDHGPSKSCVMILHISIRILSLLLRQAKS